MLHRPLEHATPSQRLANAGRIERLARIASRAVPDSPIALHIPKFIEPTPIEVAPAPLDNWAERQKAVPIPKAPWFFVLDEIDQSGLARPAPLLNQIRRVTASHYGISQADILSQRRTAATVLARQVAMYLCKTLTVRSLPEIGRHFGNRDHTTVLHSVRKITGLVLRNKALAGDIETIRAELGA